MAIQQLTEGASVEKTAWDLGYESVTAFITMFKKAVGTSPGRYVQEKAGIGDFYKPSPLADHIA